MILWGPFSQLVTLRDLPEAGPLQDSQLDILEQGGLLVHKGVIEKVGLFEELRRDFDGEVQEIQGDCVAFPGIVDAHTHLCFGGSRARDYALRVAGTSYQEIARQGGGILDTVGKTRAATQHELLQGMQQRADALLERGVTTAEVKSGYGLSVEAELRMLRAIRQLSDQHPLRVVPTCLAAHTKPAEASSHAEYLDHIATDLLPKVKDEGLSNRVDIFVEEEAFSVEMGRAYLLRAKAMGFALTVHADQFTRGSALLAAEMGALSADHLEQSESEDFAAMKTAGVVPVVLPGASIGLGMKYAAARAMLDAGLPLALASDWNPGSAPMGDLLLQAALIGAAEKLTMAETWAAITVRAAAALGLSDRGVLEAQKQADFVGYPCADYRDVLYHQGMIRPSVVVVGGDWVAGSSRKDSLV